MNFHPILALITLLSLVFGLANQDGGDTSSASVTTVWYTTTSGGAVYTLPSAYSQTFMTTYTSPISEAQSGGISDISSAGSIRTYGTTTVNEGNAKAYSGLLGLVVLGAALL